MRSTSPLLAVLRAGDGAFTDFGSQSITGQYARFHDVRALGGGKVMAAGATAATNEEPLAITARLLPNRIFGSGMEL